MQLHIIMMTDITVMLQLASKCQRTDMLREARIFNYFCKGLPYICINGMEAIAHIDLLDWFKIGKSILHSHILSTCSFNLYAEYIMRNSSWMNHKLESILLGEISTTSHM